MEKVMTMGGIETFHLRKGYRTLLYDLARENNIPKGTIIRRIVEDWLKKEREGGVSVKELICLSEDIA